MMKFSFGLLAAALLAGGSALAQSYAPPPGTTTVIQQTGPDVTTTTTIVALPPPPPATTGVAGAITAPDVIGRCLCGQQRVGHLHEQAEAAQTEYDAAHDRLASLDRQLEASRSSVDTNSTEQVDAYRRLVEEDQAANSRLYNEVLPRTQTVIKRYNEAVSRYNGECSGRLFDGAVLAQVTATLSCRRD